MLCVRKTLSAKKVFDIFLQTYRYCISSWVLLNRLVTLHDLAARQLEARLESVLKYCSISKFFFILFFFTDFSQNYVFCPGHYISSKWWNNTDTIFLFPSLDVDYRLDRNDSESDLEPTEYHSRYANTVLHYFPAGSMLMLPIKRYHHFVICLLFISHLHPPVHITLVLSSKSSKPEVLEQATHSVTSVLLMKP